MEAVQTNRGLCFTPNRFKTLCGVRLDPEIPLTFIKVIERTHATLCSVCHERWESMVSSMGSLKLRVENDGWIYEEHDLD